MYLFDGRFCRLGYSGEVLRCGAVVGIHSYIFDEVGFCAFFAVTNIKFVGLHTLLKNSYEV